VKGIRVSEYQGAGYQDSRESGIRGRRTYEGRWTKSIYSFTHIRIYKFLPNASNIARIFSTGVLH
jgi:hypothetical protein